MVGPGHIDYLGTLWCCTATVACFGIELIFGRLSVAASVPKLRHCTNRKAPVALESSWCSGAGPPQCRPLDTPGLCLFLSLFPPGPLLTAVFYPSTAHGQNPSSYRAVCFPKRMAD